MHTNKQQTKHKQSKTKNENKTKNTHTKAKKMDLISDLNLRFSSLRRR